MRPGDKVCLVPRWFFCCILSDGLTMEKRPLLQVQTAVQDTLCEKEVDARGGGAAQDQQSHGHVKHAPDRYRIRS